MIAVALALAAQAAASYSDLKPLPPCINGDKICATWERKWGKIEEDDFTPVIWAEDQTWSIQTRALATRNLQQRPHVWVKISYIKGSHKKRETLTLFAFDCGERRVQVLHQTKRNALGDAIQNNEYREAESGFEHIVPDTYISKIADFFCRV